jgi:hypothetical protein
MLYVQQSLNPNEEIVRVGEFHWWYTFNAITWIVIGFAGLIAVLYAGYYWEINQFIRANFQGLPEDLKAAAWDDAVRQKGGVFGVIKSLHIGIKLASFGALILGLLAFAQRMVIKATTEMCLTSDRLILKRGMVARHVSEISVDRIEGVDVFQGIFGRIMGFGYVMVRGMGVGEIILPQMTDPIDFRKAIERARSLKKGEV